MEALNNTNSIYRLGMMQSYNLKRKASERLNLIPSINFSLPYDSKVYLRILDTCGKIVKEIINGDLLVKGFYTNRVELKGLPSGEYVCELLTDKAKEVKALRVS